MRKRILLISICAFVIIAGLIPVACTIIQPRHIQRYFASELPLQSGVGNDARINVTVTILHPEYYRLGLTEAIRVSLVSDQLSTNATSSPIELMARIKIPVAQVEPSGPVKLVIHGANPTATTWDIKMIRDSSEDGTLWIDFVPKNEPVPVFAIPITVNVVAFLGLPFDQAAFSGGTVSFIGFVVWIVVIFLINPRKKTAKPSS